jgi:hypothetical protein
MFNYTVCNLMTGGGMSMEFGGTFSFAWLGMVILFFVVVFSRKWIGEEAGVAFNTVFAFIGAYLPYLIVVSFFCSPKFALLAGLIGYAVGGILVPMMTGMDSGGGGY